MKLIPEEDWKDLLQCEKRGRIEMAKKPEEQKFNETTAEQQCLLNKDIPDDIKVAMISSCTRILKTKLKEIVNKPITVKLKDLDDTKAECLPTQESLNEDDDFIINSIPKNYVKNAKLLLQYLRKYPEKIAWDSSGKVYIGGKQECVNNANICDLINYVVRTNFKFPNPDGPQGINRFKEILLSVGVPLTYLCPNMRKQLSNPIAKVFPKKNSSRESFNQLSAQYNVTEAPEDNSPSVSENTSTWEGLKFWSQK